MNGSCGPYVCDFPDPGSYRWLARWRCPRCGTTYVRTRRIQQWHLGPSLMAMLGRGYTIAPRGAWRLPFGTSVAGRETRRE